MKAANSGIIREMLGTKSGKIGIAMLLALVALSVSVLASTPIDTLQEWNDPSVWLDRPKSAMPAWVNVLPIGERMPEHIILHGIAADATSHDGIYAAVQNFVIEYDYDGFPSDIIYEYAASYTGSPLLKINVERPDGENIMLYADSLPYSNEMVHHTERIFSADPAIKSNLQT